MFVLLQEFTYTMHI